MCGPCKILKVLIHTNQNYGCYLVVSTNVRINVTIKYDKRSLYALFLNKIFRFIMFLTIQQMVYRHIIGGLIACYEISNFQSLLRMNCQGLLPYHIFLTGNNKLNKDTTNVHVLI